MDKLKELLKNKKVLIGIGVGVVAIALYLIYGYNGSSSSPNTATAFPGGGLVTAVSVSPAGESGQKLLIVLMQLKSINLDTSFFTDPLFTNLKDFSIMVAPEPVGRRDPFLPFDASAASGGGTVGTGGTTLNSPSVGAAGVVTETTRFPRLATASESSRFDGLFQKYVITRKNSDTSTLVKTFGYSSEQAASIGTEDVFNYSGYTLYKTVALGSVSSGLSVEAIYLLPYKPATPTRLLFIVYGTYNAKAGTAEMSQWQLYPTTDNPELYTNDAAAKAAADTVVADALSAS